MPQSPFAQSAGTASEIHERHTLGTVLEKEQARSPGHCQRGLGPIRNAVGVLEENRAGAGRNPALHGRTIKVERFLIQIGPSRTHAKR